MPRSGFVAIPFVLLIAVAACSKSPSEPPIGYPGPAPNFTLPESTLATFTRAIHDRNATNFGLCLADTLLESRDFHATFDAADLIDYVNGGGLPPADWNTANEQSFFPRFVARYPGYFYDVRFTLDVDRGGILILGGPTMREIYHLHYRVYAGPTIVVAGAVAMDLERVGAASDFKITRWEDVRDTTGVITWGKARLTF